MENKFPVLKIEHEYGLKGCETTETFCVWGDHAYSDNRPIYTISARSFVYFLDEVRKMLLKLERDTTDQAKVTLFIRDEDTENLEWLTMYEHNGACKKGELVETTVDFQNSTVFVTEAVRGIREMVLEFLD